MKKILTVLMFMGFIVVLPIQSEALIYPDYTDVGAVRIDGGYYPDLSNSYSPRGENTDFDRDGGTAFEFMVSQPLQSHSLVFDTRTIDEGGGEQKTFDFLFAIYTKGEIFQPSNNPQTIFPNIPDFRTVALTSPVHLNLLEVSEPERNPPFVYEDQTYTDYTIPFRIDLEPGKYWLAAEAPGARGIAYSNVRFDGIVTPEPSTMLLLGSGLLGAFVRRCKRA